MKNLRCLTLIIVLLLAVEATAKTATEVFDIASKSTVVVVAYDDKDNPLGFGSGVVLPDGSIATNCHVIKSGSKLAVFYQGQEYPATIHLADWKRDVCTIKPKAIKAPPVSLGTTKGLKVGARVYAIGAPEGLELSLSEGIVSSLREVEGGQYIQTTAPISPGSSGGGLFDENGELIGLISFYIEGQNLNFAIPVEWVNDLPIRHGKGSPSEKPVTEWIEKAAALVVNKDWKNLEIYSKQWIEADPNSAIALASLGKAYNELGEISKGMEAYRSALLVDPELAVAWNNLGTIYENLGEHLSAVDSFQRAIRIEPDDAVNWHNLGVSLRNAGHNAKAIEAFHKALSIDPKIAFTWNHLAVAYHNAGEDEKSYNSILTALQLDPEFVEAWYNLGICFKESDQEERVMDVYNVLKSLHPETAKEFFDKVVLPK